MLRPTALLPIAALLMCLGGLGEEACEADEAGLLQSIAKADGRRADGAPVLLETPRTIAEVFERHLRVAVEEAVQKHREDESGLPPNTAKVSWFISDVERGAQVGITWAHGCDSVGKRTGSCVFPKKDDNPATMRMKVAKPVDSKARLVTSLQVKAALINLQMSADCALCGETCTIALPMGDPMVLTLPDCPLPSQSFDVQASSTDLSFIPPFIHGSITSHNVFQRGDGSTIGGVYVVISV
mmetsp:Transcript_41446/g.83601  ORF Transcript_41446/g.83601 Transcript_41446/m.83601 type:complete len:241 (-) Transcript_41446:303-1025(-)